MSSQKYSVNQHLIETLMAWVKSGEIAIPEIQRPFVWDATQVRDLLDSLYKGYPVGYIIVWKNPNVRLKDGSVAEGKKVLIDGQQRITALSAALVGQTVVNKEYRSVRIRIAFNPQEERFEVTNPAIEKNKAWIPDIVPVMQGDISLLKLIREYTAANPEMDEDLLERVFSQLTGITRKQIGMIELAADLDIETVTEIFIRINREGVTLSQADFVMSKIAANTEYGGNELRKAIDYFCHLAVAPEFFAHVEGNDEAFARTEYFQAMRWLRNENDDLYDPSYSDMLRVAFASQFARGKLADLVGLLSGRNFETRSYEASIAESSFATLRTGVMEFMKETNFKRFLMIIKSAGFVDSSLLRNRQAPLNFAYALYLKLRSDGYSSGDVERYVRRWFVLSVLTSRYSTQGETRFEQDIRAIDQRGFGAYLRATEEAELSDAFWNVGLVQDLTTSNGNHSAFKTFLASQAKDNVRGFLSKDITVRAMLEHRGDVHHLFPREHLKREFGLKRSEYNQVANFVYTQQEINIAVGALPPEQYMGTVLEQCENGMPVYGGIVDRDELRDNLIENAVPTLVMDGGPLEYEDFLSERRKLMAKRLRDYYQAL
ncbi:DUF262 domain-containing protein [Guyparkeria sp. SCN-R1]|uniref:GmrSD restriction endonuclease domain-containing protein n=1 Tax=Guyparkeria sp. SCN-R1 TaxID=2341113 RepID=UPI000F64D212|nr:DUF262 domain-containing protein [Guyparkeria sp. SCN-R1]RRQ20346.1 DUF262 domain-containing protein [Guyparkeria sp. SCN-R1]